jgi:DNA-binding PadR family transcriptional regulator
MARPGNLLALAVLAALFEGPMHPYEIAAAMKRRGKEKSFKLRYGSLYTVIDQLLARDLIAAVETERPGKRPERTIYKLTIDGLDELRDWMRDLVRGPATDYPQFEAALGLLAVLPPDEAVQLLYTRAQRLGVAVSQIERQLAALAAENLAVIAEGAQRHPSLASGKFPALFFVESEYRLAMLKAEITFIKRLARRIVDEGWGPIELWREMQEVYTRQHVSRA